MTMQGLSHQEVLARRARGQGNVAPLGTSRTYWQIVWQNAFTFINTILFAIGIVLVLMGKPNDALVTAGLVLMNVIVGVVQEGRAKRTLDRIALLTRPKATVVREGQEQSVDPSDLVLGDILVVRPGDQIVVDGQVIGEEQMEVDESLLTGESDLIPKRTGDPVYSGSFCVTGAATYEAQKVGEEALATKITAGARAFRQIKTPLQRDVAYVIRLLILLAGQLGVLLTVSALIHHVALVEAVQMAAVIVVLVPQGLFFMITLDYALGAVRMAGKGALIQQSNAVESLSNVNVLCLDKTGTLTTNRIRYHALHPFEALERELAPVLGTYAASMTGANRTAEALAAAFPGERLAAREEVPFSSERKWSALAFEGDGGKNGVARGVYVLGAPEVLLPSLKPGTHLGSQGEEWALQGLRVLLFTYHPELVPLHEAEGTPQIPGDLVPLGLLSFSDELRAEAQETLAELARAGVRLKIISGDNPQTVAALAKQAGFMGEMRMVSGLELAGMEEAAFSRAAEENSVFGRITPQQKEKLVRALRARGHYVAMIGDGVNDVLSLKQAQLGIAMQSGSQAARSVADMVLLNDSFAALPSALREGQRIIQGMQDIMRLFLTRTFYVTLLIIGSKLINVAFPFTPADNSILALLTVGIPTLALAAWARPGPRPQGSMLRVVSHFVGPAAFSVAGVGLAVYLFFLLTVGATPYARTALTTTTVFCGLLLIVYVEPPTPFFVGGDELAGDWRPTLLAAGLFIAYLVILAFPGLRAFFDLQPLRALDLGLIVAVVLAWAVALRWAWRHNFFERLLSPSPR